MDKMTFASYKFKPSDVIEGLNRYFAETKANRYRRVPLEIHNGTVKPGKYCVFRNIVSDVRAPKIKECGYYYLICDPEEVAGVAINWLREEHDIFYTPGMEVPGEDFDVDEAAKEYEKATRTSDIFCEENEKLKKKLAEQQKKIDSYEATLSKITDIMEPKYAGPAWSETWDDLVERIKRMKEKSESLKAESTDWMDSFVKAQDSRSAFCKKLKEALDVDYRYPSYFPKMEEDILAEIERLKTEHDDARGLSLKIEELEEQLREKANENSVLRSNLDYFAGLAQSRQTELSNLRYEILINVYREVFDCSNGDPEGTDAELLQDILTEYKRTLELKNVAEEKTIKYKELARENEEKAAKYKDAAKEKDQWKRKAEDTNAGWESDRWLTNRLLNEQRDFITKVAEILDVKNPYIESEYASAIGKLRTTVAHPNRYKWLYENLKDGVASVLQEAEEKED